MCGLILNAVAAPAELFLVLHFILHVELCDVD